MPWVETESLSFTARHDSADTGFAERTLDRLEELRLRLEDRLELVPGKSRSSSIPIRSGWRWRIRFFLRPGGQRPLPDAAT